MGDYKNLFIFTVLKQFKEMYSFLGKIEAKADVKGRLFVPAQYRKQLPEMGDARFVMRKNDEYEFLDIYPESIWKEEVALIEERLNLLDAEDYLFYMQYTSNAEILEIDNSGRILIPKKHLQEAGIESEVIFVGTTKKIAVWSKENYDKQMMKPIDFAKLKKQKLGNR